MRLFDTHAHYDNRWFDSDRDALIATLADGGVDMVLNPGYDLRSSETAVSLADKYPFFYAAVGVHPSDISGVSDASYDAIEQLLAHPKVRAVGEIGLDYFHMRESKEAQEGAFRRQLDMARRHGKPVIIHNRDAGADCLAVLADFPDLRVVLHCYSEDGDYAYEAVRRGYYVSFAGNVTYKKSDGIREAARRIPSDRILLETDAPYLSPVPHRGERNSSLLMRHTAECVAALRGVEADALAAEAFANGLRFFGIELR